MQLHQLFEMAAKKLCPQCGKSMAANHYWYKGGWRCKKAKDDTPAEPQNQLTPPTQKATQQSTTKTSPTVTLDDVRKLVPEINREAYGDMLSWQVYEYKGTINVSWDYTFRRNTYFGAFKQNQQRISAANDRISQIAAEYPKSVTRVSYATAASMKQQDDNADAYGDSYSEYEQSISGGITLTP